MDSHEETQGKPRPRFLLSQETITIVTVGVALAGLILLNQGEMRAEARAYRAEARADRRAFVEQITRIVEQQGTLTGLVDGLRHPISSSGD